MCAVIIGAGTTVTTTLFSNGGITSVNFGFSPQINRLWQLGSWSPYDTYNIQQRNLSITGYGTKPDGQGGSQVFQLTPSTSCADASTIAVTVNPGACGVALNPFYDDFFPSSYSYTKDNFAFGTETWSFISKPVIEGYTGTIYFIRGISTGQISVGAGIMTAADMGVVVNDSSSKDSSGNYIEGTSGSVSAGFPGIGEYSTQREVVVSSVGGSKGRDDGNRGNVNITIPNQQIYV